MQRRAITAVVGFAAWAQACGGEPIDDAGAEIVHEQVVTDVFELEAPRKVDILLVVDNSTSMADEQATLAANFRAFVDILDDPSVDVDYRVAITTSEVESPGCSDATPENGALQLSPCTQRLDEFVAGDLDLREVACSSACTLDAAALELLPTTTGFDDEPRPRPWLERSGGVQNLPASTSMADALACFGPQGIRGCALEQPLEAMHLALDRMLDAGDPAYGFLRDDAILLIVFLTDEIDCSHAPQWADVFAPGGSEALGSSSALCWNAAVRCSDESGEFVCRSVDKDFEGVPTDDPTRAIVQPLSRYIDRVQAIEDQKRELVFDAEVLVSLIGGVGNDGAMHFTPGSTSDPEFEGEVAIAPGCSTSEGEALPPMRLAEFADAFAADAAYSVCSDNYSPALEGIANKLLSQARPRCFSACATDADAATLLLEPTCRVEQRPLGGTGEPIVACLRDAEGRYVVDPSTQDYALPDGADACHALLVDAQGITPDPNDDLSAECDDFGRVLELKVARRPGVPGPAGHLLLSCLVSAQPSFDCPGL